jgi:chromosome segregation ATPase
MGKVWFTSQLLMALWLATSVSGCATSGDLHTLKQEVLQSYVDQTESLESHKVDTSIQFDALKSNINKVSQDLKADCNIKIDGVRSAVAKLSQELNGLQENVTDLAAKSNSVVQEREKVHAALQSATRRILFLFKKEESELKDRIRFLQEVIKEYGAEEAGKK